MNGILSTFLVETEFIVSDIKSDGKIAMFLLKNFIFW